MNCDLDRNIKFTVGKYRVLLTRRPKNVYGGRFGTIEEARIVRDSLEKIHPHGQKGVKKVFVRRTVKALRMERRANRMCQACGSEAPDSGLVTCRQCLDFSSAKRRANRRSP